MENVTQEIMQHTLLKNAPHEYEIYGKTYGANKYDTSLICYAISKLALREDRITLYEYNERDLKEFLQLV